MRGVLCVKGFPLYGKKLKNSTFKNIVVLGIGGNIGNVKHTFFHLLMWFLKHKHFNVIQTTPIYQNPAFGYTHQPDFYNALFVLQTSLHLIHIFGLIFYLERKFGRDRQRAFKNAPRTLDIDIIFYNQVILKRPYLTIPHPEYQNRESVVIPMKLQARRGENGNLYF